MISMCTGRKIAFILTFILVTSCGSCERRAFDTAMDNAALGPVVIDNYSDAFNVTAAFLAGVLLSGSEKSYPALKEITATEGYRKYRAAIEKSWGEFFGPNRKAIQQWREKNLTGKNGTSVFYPFSGPDVLHPLAFYPDARDIIMFGLEPTGGVPDITKVDPKALMPQANQMLAAINFVLDHAFFVTTDMGEKVKGSSLTGISAIMMFFLARGGYEVVNVREIHIAKNGDVQAGKAAALRGEINGVEMIFKEKGATMLRRARYLQIDIGDQSPQLGRFRHLVEKYSPSTTIIKSASYLMSWDTFSRIRKIVLDNSRSILQDDSGVPYDSLKKDSTWDISYYGKYHYPLPVFRTRYQRSLDLDVRKYSKGPVPFVYGYGYGYPDMTYHIVVARKKAAGEKTEGHEKTPAH